jgi:hypothetical protein
MTRESSPGEGSSSGLFSCSTVVRFRGAAISFPFCSTNATGNHHPPRLEDADFEKLTAPSFMPVM